MSVATRSASLRSKFRGCILGGIVGDCMGSRFDGDIDTFASVSSRTDPASLRNQIPRNGGRFLFPYSVDSLMLLRSANLLADKHRDFFDNPSMDRIRDSIYEDLRSAILNVSSNNSPAIKWGFGTRQALEADPNTVKFRSNCGVISAIPSGLINPDWAASICSATHSHHSATTSATLVAEAVHFGLNESSLLPSIPSSFTRALELASLPFDEFSTDVQSKFAARFGSDASASCATAAALFSVHRTISCLPDLDTTSPKYLHQIEQALPHNRSSRRITSNLLGNSNRLDSEKLFESLTPSIEDDLPVALAINWAISLGGDSRSLGCITGSIAGAIWGEEGIPTEWLMFCQGVDEARIVADHLYDITHTSNNS